MSGGRVRYVSDVEDSARWDRFVFRDGDIVISTRSKSGTTWMQMICALLVFQTPLLPQPLSTLSPWVDWTLLPLDEMLIGLEGQRHRRFVKTHTPLDGVPIDERATYIIVARDPRDMAVSLHHQSTNMDRDRVRELLGQPAPDLRPASEGQRSVRETLLNFIEYDGSPIDRPDSLVGVAHHLADAWARRDEPNVVLIHYADLSRNLESEMRALAGGLRIEIDEQRWPGLVEAASFEHMRERASNLVPDSPGVLLNQSRFFRTGTSNQWQEWLNAADRRRYEARVARLFEPDLAAWIHDGHG